MLRSAQCLSLAGLNEEAAHYFFNLGQKAVAAQHLEKAQAWEQAAALYLQENLFLDAARCHEKDDDPVKAAAMYLKAKKLDLALPLLQSVAPAHRSFAACRLLAGKILFQKGQNDLAISLLSPLLESIPRPKTAWRPVYQAAILMELGGAADRAREAYQLLQADPLRLQGRRRAPADSPAGGPALPPRGRSGPASRVQLLRPHRCRQQPRRRREPPPRRPRWTSRLCATAASSTGWATRSSGASG